MKEAINEAITYNMIRPGEIIVKIIFAIILFGLLYAILKYASKIQTTHDNKFQPIKTPPVNETHQSGDPTIYKKKWLFTMNEKPIYHCIKKIADEKNMRVFSKVRLLDLVEPINAKDKSALWRIQAKHVDFVITTDNLIATHVIELDDNSHNTPDRQERDKFVDAVLTSCGYKILHIRGPLEETIRTFLST